MVEKKNNYSGERLGRSGGEVRGGEFLGVSWPVTCNRDWRILGFELKCVRLMVVVIGCNGENTYNGYLF